MTSQSGKQTIAIHILPYISRSKDNQTMKFGQLIEYNMRNIFLEKSYMKCGGETIPRLSPKKSKLSYLWINYLKFYTVWFYWMPSWGLSKYIETNLQTTCCYKAFLKNKNRSGISLPVSFSAWFLKKNISLIIFYYLTKFHCLVAFTSWDNEQYVYCNCLFTRLWRHKFWN